MYLVITILILFGLLFGKYSGIVFGHDFSIVVSRNFLFVGVPFFLLGNLFFELYNSKNNQRKWCVLLFGLGIVLNLVEKEVLSNLTIRSQGDIYLFTPIVAVGLFLCFFDLECSENNILCRIGRYYSTWIYILHPIVIRIVNVIIEIGYEVNNTLALTMEFVSPIIVFAISCGLAIIVDKGIKLYKVIWKYLKRIGRSGAE